MARCCTTEGISVARMNARVIAGRYHILEKIGQGGVAEVFKAVDTRLRRVVAVKLLHEHLSHDPAYVGRLENEARAVAALSHPNIVLVHNYDVADGRYFIVMEYVEGQNLKDYLAERAPLPEAECRRLAEQLLLGLVAAHTAGLVHRDVKPQNVLMTPGGELKLTDFGIAKPVGETGSTQKGLCFGTPHYIAPEQAWENQATPRSDLYAVGVILYEMLSGELPFAGATPAMVAYARVFTPPPPLREIAPWVSGTMAAVVVKAMAKDPKSRYGDAGEMLAALNAPGVRGTACMPGDPNGRTLQLRVPTASSLYLHRKRAVSRRSWLLVPLISATAAGLSGTMVILWPQVPVVYLKADVATLVMLAGLIVAAVVSACIAIYRSVALYLMRARMADRLEAQALWEGRDHVTGL